LEGQQAAAHREEQTRHQDGWKKFHEVSTSLSIPRKK
jgi:hypothetical protein